MKYNLSLYLLNINVLNFEIFYEKSKYYGLMMFDNYEFYISIDNCLGKVKILKGDDKDLIKKKFKIFIINREFKLYKKEVDDSEYCFSAFLIFKNVIVDKIYEEGNYIYEAIDKNINAYGFFIIINF